MSKVNFQGDVLIHSTNDGGEIDVEDGLIQDCNTFSTAVYISLFGGNKDDVAGRNNSFNHVCAEYTIKAREKYDLGTGANVDMYVLCNVKYMFKLYIYKS